MLNQNWVETNNRQNRVLISRIEDSIIEGLRIKDRKF